LDGKIEIKDMACQPENEKKERIQKLMQWYKERDEDVVMFQELFSLRDEVIDGMAAAGFCHYVATPFGADGSGMAIFSKYPMTKIDFLDWFDWTGENSETSWDPEAVADKGVMYAKIEKDGENYHVFDTHTQSDSLGDAHQTRITQFAKIRDFANHFLGDSTSELILFGGDFNENKYPHDLKKAEYYGTMLQELQAVEPTVVGNLKYSYDTEENPLLASLWEEKYPGQSWRELLDYVLVSKRGKQPHESHCEIIKAQWPTDCNQQNCMLSDHFPNSCTFVTLIELDFVLDD
jgi:endonuclease/exonuclease/phosphatase family metal-dependent hydrolase